MAAHNSNLRMRREDDADADSVSTGFEPKLPVQNVELAIQRIGVYGWRKYCLYLSVLLLTCLTLINLGLIIWILRVAEIKDDHAGPVFFKEHSVQIRGRAEFTAGIVAERFSGFDNEDLVLESNRAVVLKSLEDTDYSQLTVTNGQVEVLTDSFQAGYDGSVYLEANSEQVVVTANEILVTSDSGLVVDGEIQTSRLTNLVASSQGLELESVGQDIRMTASKDINIQSTTANVVLSALGDILVSGSRIVVNSSNVLLPKAPVPAEDAAASAYQLCACSSGLVFRVDAAKLCSTGVDNFC